MVIDEFIKIFVNWIRLAMISVLIKDIRGQAKVFQFGLNLLYLFLSSPYCSKNYFGQALLS